jgi:thymidylate kinase
MIVIIEGSQGSGKTHLIRSLKESVETSVFNKDVIFYKYQHVDHLNLLGINHIEPTASFHYFTISNTFTILELHKTILKDKILVFDRGIFSAYTWSVLRKRLDGKVLQDEISKILSSELYQNCHVIRVKNNSNTERDHSDIFDKHNDPYRENVILDQILKQNMELIDNTSRNNTYSEVFNMMDKLSEAALYQSFNKILSLK